MIQLFASHEVIVHLTTYVLLTESVYFLRINGRRENVMYLSCIFCNEMTYKFGQKVEIRVFISNEVTRMLGKGGMLVRLRCWCCYDILCTKMKVSVIY